ncbi:MAG: hypothetical protein CVU97_01540 [Firmicutes bacterium HGW-Firmicutes-21]|nr:MAG: hypothetical protein CVU97_01540 [Firmicutes bacterium HGW-Firmicutes-21]
MPNIEKMLETMHKQRVPDELISQLPMPRIKKATPEEIVEFIEGMNNILSKEQCISIMNEQGCNKTNKWSAMFRKWGEAHADKTLAERIALFPELKASKPGYTVDDIRLNEDGTITFIMGTDSKKGDWDCPCNPIKKLKPYDFPLIYCGCCGAHVKYTHEFALGVKLRVKEVVSSKANSNGEKPCEFIYEIVQDPAK